MHHKISKMKHKGKRTGIDFSKHDVLVTKKEGLLIHYLKQPNTITNSIKYINTEGIMSVTGDFGNWIFCREFHPSVEGGVSDGYWEEKLSIASSQKLNNYDAEETEKSLIEMLNGGIEKYGWEGDEAERMRDYYEECLSNVEEEIDYISFAYRKYPSFADHDCVIFEKDYPIWLKYVFDGFDEMCDRLKCGESFLFENESSAREAEWIDCSDRLPPSGEEVLVVVNGGDVAIQAYLNTSKQWCGSREVVDACNTHVYDFKLLEEPEYWTSLPIKKVYK